MLLELSKMTDISNEIILQIKEAKATGADILLTACPKCKIHLMCAMHDEILGQELQMEIKNFAGFVANALAR